MNISEMVARNAYWYSNETALVEVRPLSGVRKVITWKAFDERANKIANALMDKGIGKGDKVIHWMMNSINWLEAYFGIVRTGAWVVPLNFRFESEDLKYCSGIAEAKAIILGEEFREKVENVRHELPTIKDYIFAGRDVPNDMDAFEDIIGKASAKPVEIELKDEDECGLYFTSGTTGRPKPILLTHKNMICSAVSTVEQKRLYHNDCFLIMAPLYHAGAIMLWLGIFGLGGKGVLLLERITPQYIFETIAKETVTYAFLLLPWAQDILGALDRSEIRKEDHDLSCWRKMNMGAQPIPASVIKRWKEYFPYMEYETECGLTESGGPGMIHLGFGNEHKAGSVGKPGMLWDARIVNDKGEEVTPGEVGELIVKGNGVMKEYYKNPELTAQTIRNGWLHTGDMAKVDNDGFIYLVDRKKDIVIVGGENIYPVEIENVIRKHPKIYDVAVIGIPDDRLGEILAVVIDPKPGETLSEEEVNSFCEQSFPRYKRPRRIIFDKVPRNPTGKIEKPKLREKYA